MRFENIQVQNFRAIENVAIDASKGSMIVIAGPNGCGKSCVLDAIRFVKSAYGGYDDNEWDNWLNEFQISRDPGEIKKVLRNRNQPAIIKVTVQLHDQEKLYLHEHSEELMEQVAWNQLYPGSNYQNWRQRVRVQGDQNEAVKQQIAQVEGLSRAFASNLRAELAEPDVYGQVTVGTNGQVRIQRNLVLESIWRIYRPQDVGLVNYHGSHRHYAREQIGGVNLNLKTQEQQERQTTLYNYVNKYANIKTQMATEFVLQMMRESTGQDTPNSDSLQSTMKELFRRFFPGKEFEGVRANERDELEFSVTLSDGQKHDINDLSSGEKEILFGYLRLRNSSQRNSIILLDEPELHLNPKLIRGLPQFYQKHVGEDLNNQIWTVTHSDAFLREALGHVGVRVYHMREAVFGLQDGNQVKEIGQGEEEEAIFELIGDIAAYRAGGKIVIFEGENSEFDKRMAGTLFPEHERRMNFISGGNKATVRRLHEALEKGTEYDASLVFSIVDRDDQEQTGDEARGRFIWDVYHIENYLLEPDVIYQVLVNMSLQDTGFEDGTEIEQALRSIAKEQIDGLVEHSVRARAREVIGKEIRLKGGETQSDPAKRVSDQARASIEKLSAAMTEALSEAELKKVAETRKAALEAAVVSDRWKSEFRGRDLLKRFADQYTNGVRYEVLRDMIVRAMADGGVRPPGMLQVLEKIDKAQRAS